MSIRKTIFEIDNAGDGSTVGDTGQYPIFGTIDQVRWIPDDPTDTGANAIGTMELLLMPKGGTDTGVGHIIWSEGSLNLGTNIHRAPRQSVHSSAGVALDTGGDFSEPVYAAGDQLRAKIVPADTGSVAGELHVWHGSRGHTDGI